MSVRRKNDNYPTDAGLTRKIMPYVSGRILEPCAGSGQMVAVLSTNPDNQIITGDIDSSYKTDYPGHDATNPNAPYYASTFDWVVTNPPFGLAHLILPAAFERAQVGVAFLLRLSYLEPTKNRGDWLREHERNMRHLFVFGQPRPTFTGRGNDTVTTAWAVWLKDWDWYALGMPCPFRFLLGWQAHTR